jgi:hypothetical protein
VLADKFHTWVFWQDSLEIAERFTVIGAFFFFSSLLGIPFHNTLAEWEMFRRIQDYELMNLNWKNPNTVPSSANVLEMIARSNNVHTSLLSFSFSSVVLPVPVPVPLSMSTSIPAAYSLPTAPKVASWIATTILQTKDLSSRVQLIDRFVDIGEACLKINNLNTTMAIIGGLNMTPVQRLRRTWEVRLFYSFPPPLSFL